MDGPQHYRWAEARLELAKAANEVDEVVTYNVAMAQVHATLALVAATIDAVPDGASSNAAAWAEVAR